MFYVLDHPFLAKATCVLAELVIAGMFRVMKCLLAHCRVLDRKNEKTGSSAGWFGCMPEMDQAAVREDKDGSTWIHAEYSMVTQLLVSLPAITRSEQ
jgi:hypothetical protein